MACAINFLDSAKKEDEHIQINQNICLLLIFFSCRPSNGIKVQKLHKNMMTSNQFSYLPISLLIRLQKKKVFLRAQTNRRRYYFTFTHSSTLEVRAMSGWKWKSIKLLLLLRATLLMVCHIVRDIIDVIKASREGGGGFLERENTQLLVANNVPQYPSKHYMAVHLKHLTIRAPPHTPYAFSFTSKRYHC